MTLLTVSCFENVTRRGRKGRRVILETACIRLASRVALSLKYARLIRRLCAVLRRRSSTSSRLWLGVGRLYKRHLPSYVS